MKLSKFTPNNSNFDDIATFRWMCKFWIDIDVSSLISISINMSSFITPIKVVNYTNLKIISHVANYLYTISKE